MNVTDAAYHTVHDCPGGAAALAARLIRVDAEGNRKPMSEAVLNSKVNPNTTSHHLTLAEASAIIGLTGDARILHALNATHGYVAMKVDNPETGSLTCAMFEAAKAKGGLAGLVLEALSDGRITANEASGIARQVMTAVQKLTAVAEHARAEASKGQPA